MTVAALAARTAAVGAPGARGTSIAVTRLDGSDWALSVTPIFEVSLKE